MTKTNIAPEYPMPELQGVLGCLLGLANSGDFGRNVQPTLNNFAPY